MENKIIFILGNGRSGTHFVADLINSSGKFQYKAEEEPMFSLSCQINIMGEKDKLPELIELYKTKDNYIDKCHPNLFIAEKLQKSFPKSIFVVCERGLQGTMDSMLKHNGCLAWFDIVKDYPNKYLGITSLKKREKMTTEQLVEARWLAHQKQIDSLKSKKFQNFFFFNYENRHVEAKRLDYFLKIQTDKSIIR